MQGLYRSTGYWQTQAAKKDWQFISQFATANGLSETAAKLTPSPEWGWRRIDERIGKLREKLQAAGLTVPTLPSSN